MFSRFLQEHLQVLCCIPLAHVVNCGSQLAPIAVS
jgi:hypothetical protein